MHICYLANSENVHTQRWVRHFHGRGAKVSVISFSPGKIDDVECHYVKTPFRSAFKYVFGLPRIRQLLKQLKPSILHAHYATGYGLVGACSGYHPFVLTCWGSDVLIAPNRSYVYRAVLRYVLKRADIVTSMAEHMTRRLPALGVEPSKVMTLPFGIDDTVFHPGLRRAVGSRDFPTIISTRNFERLYNVELLLRSLPDVRRRFSEVRCILVGHGTQREELRQEASRLGVESMIEFTGTISQGEVAQRLAACDVFCTLAYSDGNNVSLNEAMACGCFPIASKIPANEEWIVDGQNGFLVPVDDPEAVADAICRALCHPELREKAAIVNWQIIQERGLWRKSMERMEEVYQKLKLQGTSSTMAEDSRTGSTEP